MDTATRSTTRGPAAGTRLVVLAAFGLLLPAACGREAPEGDPPAAPTPAEAPPPTLGVIMQGLEADMAAAAHGLWIEDALAVAEAARRVADHPKVTPETATAIQATLGAEFGDFAAFDHQVHEAAAYLSEVARDGAVSPDALLSGYQEVQAGCVACHARFRARVSAALAPGADGS